MARQLASKVALGVRTDALAEFEDDADDETRASLGIRARAKLENNLRLMEGKPLSKGVAVGPNGIPLGAPPKWDVKEARKYNIDVDGLAAAETPAPKKPLIQEVDEEMADAGAGAAEQSDAEMQEAPSKEDKKDKKDKKEKKEKKDKPKKSKEPEAATPAKITEKDYERLAKEVGMSVSKFTRRLEKGQIKVKADGTVEVLSKKEAKAEEGEEQAAQTPVKAQGSKRKHEEEAETPAKEEKHKKKKKKHGKE
jgi:nucleolar protein 58